MNLVGKIFTVLIFVMAMFVMTIGILVYSTHTNWQKEITKQGGLRDQLRDLKAEKDSLTADKDKFEKELTELANEKQKWLASSENRISELNNEIKQRDQEKAKLTQSERDAVATMKVTQEEAKKLREEVEGLRKDTEKAQADRDEHFKEMQRLTDDLHKTVNELTTLKERSKIVAADLAKATETLRIFGLDKNIDYANKQAPPVDGHVLAVKTNGKVEISIGADDGLRKGHKLEVYRITSSGSTYVGRIEVMETEPRRAVCSVDSKIPLSSEIKNGDNVTSKLDR
jgi:hypothetical protein